MQAVILRASEKRQEEFMMLARAIRNEIADAWNSGQGKSDA